MSKRSFEEFSTISSDARYISALNHANSLLEAAESLKQDLERLREQGASPSHEKILSTLKIHNAKILPTAQALSQDETSSVGADPEGPHKVQKVDLNQKPSNSDGQPGLAIPHPAMLTKWTLQDASKTDALPPLPPILDPVLEKAARTHAGIASGLGEMDYERLEWLGDAYMFLASSALIYQTFPNLGAGRCSQLRERLVKNETLSDFTVRYNIDKRARLPTEYQPGGRPSETGAGTSASRKERKKVLGDLLEAYAAAAILGDADGLPRVIDWLKSIWGTTLHHEIRDEYKNRTIPAYLTTASGKERLDNGNMAQPAPQNLSPKVVLAQVIGMKGVRISYRDEGKPKIDKNTGLQRFTVAAYYDGLGETNLHLGYGSDVSKQKAGIKAAMNALENKKLIKRLRKLREDVEATLTEARDSQDK